METRSLRYGQCGALAGLALLVALPALPDDGLRKQVHREFGHRSYMLLEDADGARLYLFADGKEGAPAAAIAIDPADEAFDTALKEVWSDDERTRVLALTRLAGVDNVAALEVAVILLTDPSAAVRDEARHLILDHPRGESIVDAFGLIDDDAVE